MSHWDKDGVPAWGSTWRQHGGPLRLRVLGISPLDPKDMLTCLMHYQGDDGLVRGDEGPVLMRAFGRPDTDWSRVALNNFPNYAPTPDWDAER